VDRIRSAFPDINSAVEDAFGAEDKVVLRWSGYDDAFAAIIWECLPAGSGCE
jgi:hypothetical protein